jgi:hypothetical protein
VTGWCIDLGLAVLVGAVLVACWVSPRRTRRRRVAGDLAAGRAPGAAPGETWGGLVQGSLLAGDLARGIRPLPRRLWVVVPRPGEHAYLIDVPVIYSRYGPDLGVSASPPQSSLRVYYYGGCGAGGAGMLFYAAASLVSEAVDYSRTREAVTPRWRMGEQTHAILTDQRILVHAGGRWVLSIDLDSITGFYPRFADSCIELHFGEESMPARLEGPAMPSIAAWVGWALYGADGLRAHSQLNTLLPVTARR